MGNSYHGTTYMRVGGDDGELLPWHYIYEGRRGRWGTPTMTLHIHIQHRPLLPSLPTPVQGYRAHKKQRQNRGTSLIRNSAPLGPYSRPYCGLRRGSCFL